VYVCLVKYSTKTVDVVVYMVFHKKDLFFFLFVLLSFIIYSNDDQFIQIFLPVVAEEILIQTRNLGQIPT